MVDGWHFSFAGFSDAEWHCILGTRQGEKTGLGQILDAGHGNLLLDVLRRRQGTKNFLFAVPKILWTMPGFKEGQIDWFLGKEGIAIEGYERDMVTDDMARQADMHPFIRQLQDMPTAIIGPKEFRKLGFLKLRHHTIISTPNLHMEQGGIDKAVADTLAYGSPGVYLVSAGVSAAVIIDRLHDRIPNAWFIDCGSIWDAFVGLGEQREWRYQLYRNPGKLHLWKDMNIEGKHGRSL